MSVSFSVFITLAILAKGVGQTLAQAKKDPRALPPPIELAPNRYFTNQIADPFRKFENTYADLRPLFAWIENGKNGPNPMPTWQPLSYQRVISVSDKGLLLEKQSNNPGQPIFLVNYPRNVVDGSAVHCVAQQVGTYQYRSAGGAVRTVVKYDYGVPFTPKPPPVK